MTTEREAFEAHIDDCIESEVGLEQALVKDGFGDYCVPWVSSKWNSWRASRKVALEEAAKLCFDNSEDIGTKNGRSLSPFPHECAGLHSGMTYAKAIRSLK